MFILKAASEGESFEAFRGRVGNGLTTLDVNR